jgi:hypothetical protein
MDAEEIAARCETLSSYRFDQAIPERLVAAAEHQRAQGEMLAAAARVIRAQQTALAACMEAIRRVDDAV